MSSSPVRKLERVSELDAVNLSFKARVVLIGRTGLDDVARSLRGSEVVRVRTPIEAIAEVAIPSAADTPKRVVVIVGTDSALSVEEFGENGDGAMEFLRGLHSIHPRARLLRAVNRRNMHDPAGPGYHGCVSVDSTALEFVAAFTAASRMILNGRSAETVDAGDSAAPVDAEPLHLHQDPKEDSDIFFEGIRDISTGAEEPQEFPHLAEAPETEPEAPAPLPEVAPPRAKTKFEDLASYPSMMTAPGGIFINDFTGTVTPMEDVPLQNEPVQAAPVSPTTQPTRPAGPSASDKMLQAILAGVDPRVAGLEIIRQAVGDASVELIDINNVQAGVVVSHEGREIGKLSGKVSAEALTPHAAWLGPWLRLDEHLAELRDWAFTDSLTGAWNRRYFEMFLKESMEEAKKLRRSLSILMFDIDNFKRWNDENGHAAGDDILIETVKLLKSVIRPTDKVCRIGGDEFAVIFHEPKGPRDPGSHHPEDLSKIATRFQTQIRNKRFPKLASTHSPLGISGGMATYPWDARNMEELIQVADQRAMQCKKQGKNAIVFGDETV